jgi:hypothetical protein
VQLNIFYLEYSQIPGDMTNANDYWPGCNSGTTSAQCNGNGNGTIEYTHNSNDNESTRYWQHLYLAGLINKNFDGTGIYTNCDESSCYHSKSSLSKYFVEYQTNLRQFRVPPLNKKETFVISGAPESSGSPNWWYNAFTVP